jgi:hypothetical protein
METQENHIYIFSKLFLRLHVKAGGGLLLEGDR